MKTNILSGVILTLLCTVLFVAVYSGVIWAFGQVIAPNKGLGEVIVSDGKIVGFTKVGQSFTRDNYFWSRPSSVNYNAAGSGGSNKGPSNPDYLQVVKARVDTFLVHNPGVQKSSIPAELVSKQPDLRAPLVRKQRALEATLDRIARDFRFATLREVDVQHLQVRGRCTA